MVVSQIGSLSSLNGSAKIGTGALPNDTQPTGNNFAQMLDDALKQVDALQKDGEAASVGLAIGQIQDVHTAMIALQKASLSLSLTVEVRNKVLDAYNEMMRMQI